MGAIRKCLILEAGSRQELEGLLRKRNAEASAVMRAKIILLAGSGLSNAEIARRLDCVPHVVGNPPVRFDEGEARVVVYQTRLPTLFKTAGSRSNCQRCFSELPACPPIVGTPHKGPWNGWNWIRGRAPWNCGGNGTTCTGGEWRPLICFLSWLRWSRTPSSAGMQPTVEPCPTFRALCLIPPPGWLKSALSEKHPLLPELVMSLPSESAAPALPPVTPHAIRDELTAMIVNDLLGPAGGPEEELHQREDRVTNRYLVGMLAPKATPVEAEEQDALGTDEQDDAEVGATDLSTPPAATFFPNSIGLSFVVESGTSEIRLQAEWGRYRKIPSTTQVNPKNGNAAHVWKRHPFVGAPLVLTFLPKASRALWRRSAVRFAPSAGLRGRENRF
jgi:hypothetical protein